MCNPYVCYVRMLLYTNLYRHKARNITAIPCTDSCGYGRLGLPEFIENQHMNVARLSAPGAGRLNPPTPRGFC